jgi:hypothetical protein
MGTYKHGHNNSRLYHPHTRSAPFHKKKTRPTSACARSVYLTLINVLRCIDRTAAAPETRQYSRFKQKKTGIPWLRVWDLLCILHSTFDSSSTVSNPIAARREAPDETADGKLEDILQQVVGVSVVQRISKKA